MVYYNFQETYRRTIALLKYNQPTISPNFPYNFPKSMLANLGKKGCKEFRMLLVTSEKKDPLKHQENTFCNSPHAEKLGQTISLGEELIIIEQFLQTRIMYDHSK